MIALITAVIDCIYDYNITIITNIKEFKLIENMIV